MNSQKVTDIIELEKFFTSDTKTEIVLRNKKEMFVTGKHSIILIDIQNKVIIKDIEIYSPGYLSYIYKISENILLVGCWNNYIEQLEYDEIKKDFKVVSRTEIEKPKNYELFKISSIAMFNNNLIVTPYNNQLGKSSLIIYQLKK